MSEYLAYHKAGSRRNGHERDKGQIYHAKKQGPYGEALCGTRPRGDWTSWPSPVENVNCPKCLKKLEELGVSFTRTEDRA